MDRIGALAKTIDRAGDAGIIRAEIVRRWTVAQDTERYVADVKFLQGRDLGTPLTPLGGGAGIQ